MRNIFLTILFSKNIQSYTIDTENSQLRWEASKVTGSHWGYIKMKKGEIILNGEKVVSGEFFVDLNTITVEDMGVSPWAEKLVNHLKSDDFFSVESYPTEKKSSDFK